MSNFEVGTKEFIEYANKANIPKVYRVWTYALWREARKDYQKLCGAVDEGKISLILEEADTSLDGGVIVTNMDDVLDYINSMEN